MMKLYTDEEGIELLTTFKRSAFAINKPVSNMTIPISVNIMMTHFEDLITWEDKIVQVYKVDGHVLVNV